MHNCVFTDFMMNMNIIPTNDFFQNLSDAIMKAKATGEAYVILHSSIIEPHEKTMKRFPTECENIKVIILYILFIP